MLSHVCDCGSLSSSRRWSSGVKATKGLSTLSTSVPGAGSLDTPVMNLRRALWEVVDQRDWSQLWHRGYGLKQRVYLDVGRDTLM
jgi:hypothetical protein